MYRYLILLVVFLFCSGCGSATVVNSGPKSEDRMKSTEEGPSTTWTIIVEPQNDPKRK